MTWALVIFTAVMAVAAIVVGVAVTATESVSEADIQACMAQNPFFAGAPTREECEEDLRVADEDVGAIFILWLVGFSILMLVWFKRRPRSPSRSRPSSGSLRGKP
jgi:hypothetical protein